MLRTLRIAGGWALGAVLLVGGCSGAEEKAPAKKPETKAIPVPARAEPTPPAEPLRQTPPDPEVVGVKGSLPSDIPVPQSAQALQAPLVAAGTTRATFESSESLASLHAFYKERLAKNGWVMGSEKELEGQVLMSAKKDKREASVAISESAGKSQFLILITGE
jgi:hypothetical protein